MFAARDDVQPGTVRLLYEGLRIVAEHSPRTLDMDDGDCIDYIKQLNVGVLPLLLLRHQAQA